jgi:hypothetical protein
VKKHKFELFNTETPKVDHKKIEKPFADRALTRSELAHQMYKDQERKFQIQKGVLQQKQVSNQSAPQKEDILDKVIYANKNRSLKHRISNIKSELNGVQI